MSLTSSSAVVRRLVVSPGHAPSPAEPQRLVATPAALSAVLRAFGRPLDRLPVRTAVYIGGPARELPSVHEGFTIRTERSPGRALRRAARELHDGTTDLAIVAGFAEPDPGTITVHAVRRAAEAVADSERIIGLLDLTTGGPDDLPPVRPLSHGHRETGPDRHRLLLWSGRDERDEARVRGELLSVLDGSHSEAFPALPTAVPCGTPPGPVRGAAVTVSALAAASVHKAQPVRTGRPRQIALLFPGQGSQHTGMATGLYRRDPVFTAAVDAVFAHMGEEGRRVREDWLTPGPPRIPVDDVRRAQPLLFAVDYALGRLVLSWGVRPAALLGHSAGELVAATLAGVVSLGDAVSMVMSRVREAVRIPEGGMLAVAASEERLSPYLTGEVVVAAVNAAQQVMLAGPAAPLAEVRERLRADGLTVVDVPASSPFHSPAMAPAAEQVEADYRRIPLREPVLPLYSGYTGTLMGAQEALDPRFWARQITDTVRFKDALEELLAIEDVLLIEAGPRQTLTAFARRHRAVRLGASAAAPLLPARPGTGEADRQSVLTAAARIWTEGHDLDMRAVSGLWTWSADRARTSAALAGVPG
ncbi:acyltransferase domain-containing protein [Streptomyces griseus]|uniref:Acyltransferase domain-containing protein n=1 Tax=Streptomyces stephensoniae TaxID=3375367 RepID=A0ABU2W9I8_9ACTN|nr:acyltransferase domain-containing protein [Streptomyces griseus]MDT0494294.1 acyltransferase domain-containing protein [Streptomyces griseus]